MMDMLTPIASKGYKQTEIGLIPQEWGVHQLSELFKTKQGLQQPIEDQSLIGGDDKCRFIRIIDLTNSDEQPRYISKPAIHHLISTSDLFMVRYGSPGMVAIGYEGVIANNLFRLIPRRELCSEFYYHYFTFVVEAIQDISGSSTMPAISFSTLGPFPIPLPPTLGEQQAIAEALSDMDAMIRQLELLIEKKRAIKQGAMQELLKPKEGWVDTLLGTKLSFQVGFPFSSIFFDKESGVRLIRNGDLKLGGDRLYYSGDYSVEFLVNDSDVLIGMDGDFQPHIWSGGLALLNQRVGRLVSKSDISLRFIYYYLQSHLKMIESITAATTVKHLSHKDVENLFIPIPNPEEQDIIANTLSDIDIDIRQTQQKLTKARQLKQGMMQELLTGRKRLV